MDSTAAEMLCQIREQVAEKIGGNRFRTWFGEATRFQLSGDALDIAVPNAFVGNWITTNYLTQIADSARQVIGSEPRIKVRISPAIEPVATGIASPRNSELPPAGPSHGAVNGAPRTEAPARLRGDLVSFVAGPGNELAYMTACAVARAPGKVVKHLLLHGGCGLGKTHLLHGICNAINEDHPHLEWRYVSGEEFTNEFIYAVKAGRIDLFRAKFRNVDVLAIDDIHFLANKKATQDEFLHTFNAIDVSGKTVVLSSDRHPRTIAALSEPLVNRLLAATIAVVDPPDYRTRREILRRRAATMQCEPPPEVLDYVARHVSRNVRELEGALFKLAAMATLMRESITLELARRALADLLDAERPPASSEIEQLVTTFFGVGREAIRSKSRDRNVSLARAVTMYLIRKHTSMSFPEIGRATGHKNHSTVLMAARRIQDGLDRNGAVAWRTSTGLQERPLKQVLEEIEQKLR